MRYFLIAFVVLGVLSFVRVRRKMSATQKAESAGKVSVDDGGATFTTADGTSARVAWNDLASVHIETVAGGLSADEVIWALGTGAEQPAFRVTQTTPGANAMIARLQQLPGFRYEPMINSMITTEATRFVVWERVSA